MLSLLNTCFFVNEIGLDGTLNSVCDFVENCMDEKNEVSDFEIKKMIQNVRSIILDEGGATELRRVHKLFPNIDSIKLHLNDKIVYSDEFRDLLEKYSYRIMVIHGRLSSNMFYIPPKIEEFYLNAIVGCPCCIRLSPNNCLKKMVVHVVPGTKLDHVCTPTDWSSVKNCELHYDGHQYVSNESLPQGKYRICGSCEVK